MKTLEKTSFWLPWLNASLFIGLVTTIAGLPILNAAEVKPDKPAQPAAIEKKGKVISPDEGWVDLFDGKTLKGWQPTDFAGHGEVKVEDGKILLEMGNDLTGITFTNLARLPRNNYEIEVEAMRVDGNDFFCGLTFPVKKDPCSFIVGGWGGGVVGLSSIDGNDAANNETSRYTDFESGRWYTIRVRVTDKKIQAWIDNKSFVNLDIEDRLIGIRIEVEQSRPLGIACWRTKSAIREIRLRSLE